MVHQPGHQIAEQDTNASAQKTNDCCFQQELFPDIPRITAAGETAVTRAATQAPVTEQEAVRQRAERRSWTP